MTETTLEEAKLVYYKHYAAAESYLAQYGDDGISKNAGVTQSYNNISEQDPLFMWSNAATTGSFQVGQALRTAQNPLVQNCNSTNALSEGLAWGNQAIHNNMLALYHTHKELGLEGLAFLMSEIDKKGQPLLSPEGLDGFIIYDNLANKAEQIAKDLSKESGGAFISPDDPAIIEQLLSNPESLSDSKLSI